MLLIYLDTFRDDRFVTNRFKKDKYSSNQKVAWQRINLKNLWNLLLR